MKVWVVTSGAYSEYSIDAIFSTEEKAQEYLSIRNHSEVTEWELDTLDAIEYVAVTLYANGNVAYDPCYRMEGIYEWRYCREIPSSMCYRVVVKRNSAEIMLKAARDAVAEYKATKAGIS